MLGTAVMGSKLIPSHGFGQKAKSVMKKVNKVALGGGVTAATLAGAKFLSDVNPDVQMVRQKGTLERALRGM